MNTIITCSREKDIKLELFIFKGRLYELQCSDMIVSHSADRHIVINIYVINICLGEKDIKVELFIFKGFII